MHTSIYTLSFSTYSHALVPFLPVGADAGSLQVEIVHQVPPKRGAARLLDVQVHHDVISPHVEAHAVTEELLEAEGVAGGGERPALPVRQRRRQPHSAAAAAGTGARRTHVGEVYDGERAASSGQQQQQPQTARPGHDAVRRGDGRGDGVGGQQRHGLCLDGHLSHASRGRRRSVRRPRSL